MEKTFVIRGAGNEDGLMAVVILSIQMDRRIVVCSVTVLNMGLGLLFHRLVSNIVVVGKEAAKLEMHLSFTKMVMFITVRL